MVDYKGQPQQKHHVDHAPTAEPPGPVSSISAGMAGNPLLGLQRAIGNKAVRRELNAAALSPRMILGQQQTLGNMAVQRLLRTRTLQAKLTVGAPDDVYEQEAEQVAAAVVGRPEASPRMPPAPPIPQQAGVQAGVAPSRSPDAPLSVRPVKAVAPVSGGYIGWPTVQRQGKGAAAPGIKEAPGIKGAPGVKEAPGPAPAEGAPEPKLEDLLKASVELGTFTASNYALPNFTIGLNGKFDVNYQPAAKTLGITVKVGFKFFNDPVDKSAAGKWTQGDKTSYATGFLNKVQAAWSDRYTFKNVREPQAVWKALNPVHVSLSVLDVSQAGKIDVTKAPKGQHFLVQPHKEAASGANFTAVSGGKLNLYKGDDQTQSPFFQKDATAGELARIAMANPSPILFDNDSAVVKAADRPKLEFLAAYLRRINQPKFDVKIVGRASSTGQDAYNLKLSEKRAKAVEGVLKTGGATNHNLLPSAVGETGAKIGPEWRRVEIVPSIAAGYVNAFDTFPHEFGHMLGLGDEYQTATSGALTTHHDLVKKAFGKKYADIVAKRGASGGGTTGQSGNIMDVGQDIRIYDYVTFWSALAETTLKKAAVPTPKFGYDDWKFNE